MTPARDAAPPRPARGRLGRHRRRRRPQRPRVRPPTSRGPACATLVARGRDAVGGAAATERARARRPRARARPHGRPAARLDRPRPGPRRATACALVQPAARVPRRARTGRAITLWGDLAAADGRDLAAVSARRRDRVGRVRPAGPGAVAGPVAPRRRSRRPTSRRRAPATRWSGCGSGCTSAGLGESDGRHVLRVLPQPVADFVEDRRDRRAARAARRARHPLHVDGPAVGGHDRRCSWPTPPATTAVPRARPCTPGAARARSPRRSRRPRGAPAPRSGPARGSSAVTTHDGRVTGVALASGEELAAPRSWSAASTPKRRCCDLVDPEVLGPPLGWQAGNLRRRGRVAKVNLALAELPDFPARRRRRAPRCAAGSWSAPSIDDVERARRRQVRPAAATSRGWRRRSRASSTRCWWTGAPRRRRT